MELVVCPECGDPAAVTWRAEAPGPAEHAKVHCVRRHWFLLPTEQLTHWPTAPPAESAA
jgi:hypothetical protein